MTRGTSTVKGSLRAAAIAITIISLITFSTMGYSIYSEYESLISPSSVSGIRTTYGAQGTSVIFSLSGKIPNSGLYPIDLSFSIAATSGGFPLASSSSAAVRLLPGEDRQVNLTSQIDLLTLTNVPNAQRFLLNQSVITVLTTLNAGLEPFASISIGTPSNVTLPPLMGRFRISGATVTTQGTQSVITVPVSFTDEASFQYPFSMYALLNSGQSLLGNSTVYTGLGNPGQQTAFTLRFTIPSTQVRSGTYQLSIHVRILNNDIPIRTALVVP